MRNINVRITGRRSFKDLWKNNQKLAVVFIDNDWVKSDHIAVENKDGAESSEITIRFENERWTGTLEELAKRIGLKH